jgi:hypothetical protein
MLNYTNAKQQLLTVFAQEDSRGEKELFLQIYESFRAQVISAPEVFKLLREKAQYDWSYAMCLAMSKDAAIIQKLLLLLDIRVKEGSEGAEDVIQLLMHQDDFGMTLGMYMVLKRRGFLPRVRGVVLKRGGSLPRVRGVVLERRGFLPRVRGVVLKRGGSLPKVRGIVLKRGGSLPKVRGVVLKRGGSLPKVRGVVLKTMAIQR